MFKNLVKQLKSNCAQKTNPLMSSPFKESKELKDMACHALGLFEKQNDIKKFTQLALSDPENTSHNDLAAKIFDNDPLSDEALFELSENSRFLEDLGL